MDGLGVQTECRHREVGLYYEPDVTEAGYFAVFPIHKAKPPVSSPVLLFFLKAKPFGSLLRNIKKILGH